MGISSDGIICYGFPVRDEGGEILEGGTPSWLLTDDPEAPLDFDDFLVRHYPFDRDDPDQLPNETTKEYQAASKDRYSQWREHVAQIGVDLVWHCSYEYPMYLLAATASVKTAYRGDPQFLGQDLTQNGTWRNLLRDFCNKTGIPFEEPQWILCSWYG